MFGTIAYCFINAKSSKVCSNWLPFPYALIKALYVITSGNTRYCLIVSKNTRACSGWTPFPHALIKAL